MTTQEKPPQAVPAQDAAHNPYVGPQPFTAADRFRFFGRERESSQLLPLVISERLVVFYSQSGAGKSSLINASLVPELERRNFKVLSGRVSGQPVECLPEGNIFTYNLLLSLEHREGRDSLENERRLVGKSLAEYLSGLEIEPVTEPAGDGAGASQLLLDAPPIIGGIRPLAVIIDQFEEIFTTNPGAWMQRGPFFEQLRDAMRSDPYLWVVLAIREDYVAMLDPFSDLLPGKLRARFYMQRMDTTAARLAIARPVENIRPFTQEAVDMLAENLCQITVGRDEKTNKPIYAPGPYVEPVQLQVVCYQLWRELQNHPGSEITSADLLALAGNMPLSDYINDSLGDFYNQAIQEVFKEFPNISERRMRDWFSHELITDAETRGGVIQGKTTTGNPPTDLPNEVVEAFQKRFLVRAEIRGENVWFELSHDRFVAPVLQKNRAWLERNPFPIEAAAQAYFKTRDASRLLDGRQLKSAIDLLNQHPEELSEQGKQFILTSQEVSHSRERRRQWIAVGVLSALVILALVFAILATSFGFQSEKNARQAQLNAIQALNQGSTAEVASYLAQAQAAAAKTAQAREGEQRMRAEAANTQAATNLGQAHVANTQAAYNLATAQVANVLAGENLKTAVAAESFAKAANVQSQASRLSSLSDYFRFSNPRLSLLLAGQAVRFLSTWESRRSLLTSLQTGLQTQVKQQGSPYYTVQNPGSVAYSPDGKLLAIGLASGDVHVFSQDPTIQAPTPPIGFSAQGWIGSVAFSPDNKILAEAGQDAVLRMWDLETGQYLPPLHPFPENTLYYSLNAMAFQPAGKLLVVISNRDRDARVGRVFFYNMDEVLKNPAGVLPVVKDCGPGNCLSAAWSPDGKHVAVGSSTGDLRVFDISPAGAIINGWRRDKAHQDQVWGLAWYQDNQRLVSGGIDQSMLQWDTRSQDFEPVLSASRADTPMIYSLAMSPSGRYLVAGGVAFGKPDPAKYVTVWDADTLQRKNYPGLVGAHTQAVNTMTFNPFGDRFATGGQDHYVRQWKFEPQDPMGKTLWTVEGSGRVDGAGMNADGSIAAVETQNNAVNVWNNKAQKPDSYNLPHSALAYTSVNQKYVILLGHADGTLSAIDPLTGKASAALPQFPLVVMKNTTVVTAAVSPDGRRAAAAACPGSSGACNQLVFVDLAASPAKITPLKQGSLGTGVITSLAFNSDGSALAVGNSEGQIFLVDPLTGGVSQVVTEGLTLSTAKLSVTSLAFGPADTNLLVAGFFDRRIALWEASTRDPIGVFDERMSGKPTGLNFYQENDGAWYLLAVSAQGEVRRWEISQDAWIARACGMAKPTNQLNDAEKARFFSAGASPVDLCPVKK